MLARSSISVGTSEDEKEARRCMSPRLPTFAKKTKAQKCGHLRELSAFQARKIRYAKTESRTAVRSLIRW